MIRVVVVVLLAGMYLAVGAGFVDAYVREQALRQVAGERVAVPSKPARVVLVLLWMPTAIVAAFLAAREARR